jgi:hypothetical protein
MSTWTRRDDGGAEAENHPRGSNLRYGNLRTVSTALRGYGRALKIVGWAIGIAGGVAGLAFAGKGGDGDRMFTMFGVMILVIASAAGLAVHAMATMIAATGEGLLAVSDIAVNTAKRKVQDDDER